MKVKYAVYETDGYRTKTLLEEFDTYEEAEIYKKRIYTPSYARYTRTYDTIEKIITS